ncbi:MAG: nuclear transport factor 2 family protein [Acidimicrobiia bacterium]
MAAVETHAQNPIEVVARLVEVIERGDLEHYRSLYAPGAVVWTCFDDFERDVDGSFRVIEWLVGASTERRYDITRRIEIEGGVLQQHVLHVTTNEGRAFSMPACLVIQISDGLITRVDEYLDPKPVTTALG